jgi:GNAT superfamily N-acetyltransferase
MPPFTIRSFTVTDIPAALAIGNDGAALSPERLAEARAEYEGWPAERYYRARWVAENDDKVVVGWGEITHRPWQFHPDKYGLHVEVAPDRRRQGAGGLILERLIGELRARQALLARAFALEGDAESIGFLTHRGFREVWRELESRLDVTAFDPRTFAGAEERVARQDVTITTLADEMSRDPGVLREVYDLSSASQDDPQLDPVTPLPFEEFVAGEISGAKSLPEAWFLARSGGRLVGVSTLERVGDSVKTVESGYTGVHPQYRRRGIALALKLRTIAYARTHGYRHIQTGSNAVNAPMLHLNAALGFEPQPARITYEHRFEGRAGNLS